MEIKVKKLDPNAKLPTRGSDFAAGYDLYALERVEIQGGQTVKVRTGIALEIPEDYFGAIYARSGLATKHGIRPANCVGIIDSDYRGEIIVALHNDTLPFKDEERQIAAHTFQHEVVPTFDASYTVESGERVAQLVIQKHGTVKFIESSELDDSSRGEGGFGSTGSN